MTAKFHIYIYSLSVQGEKINKKCKILNVFIKVFMNTNAFEMYSNTNTLPFSEKYLNTYEYEYKYILPRPDIKVV